VKKIKNYLIFTLVVIFLMTGFTVGGFAKQPIIGLSAVGVEHNWDINAYNGVISRAKELGVDLLSFDGERRPEKQLSDIRTLISRKVDCIIVILGQRDVIEPAIKEAREKGIPVVTADFNTPYSLCNVSTNNFSAMSDVVLQMVSDLKGEGEVGIFFRPGSPIGDLRKKVFDLVLSEYPGIKIVAEQTIVIPGTVPDSYNKTKDMLRTHPEIDAFWTVFDMPMIGAAQAIADMGLQNIGCYGFDGDPTAMEMISDPSSAYMATVAQQPFKIGQTVLEAAVDVINGKEVPVMKFVPAVLVTRENVKEVLETLPQYK